MSFTKKLFSSLFIFGISAAANAGDLTIINNTNQDTTSIINNGACSNIFGASGVTKAHSSNVVNAKIINLACVMNPSHCNADVYMTDNCTGPKVASVMIDVRQGIKSVSIIDPAYQISGAGFSINIDGGA